MRTLILAVLVALAVSQTAVSAEPAKKKIDTVSSRSPDVTILQDLPVKKKGTFEFAAAGGLVSTDPFLSVKDAAISAGFYLFEWLSFQLEYGKFFAGESGTLDTLQKGLGVGTNTNKPQSFMGGTIAGNLAFGKLTFLGASLFYYDIFLCAGGGITSTENGSYPTAAFGIGHHIYLNRSPNIALKAELRETLYKETIVQRILLSELGTPLFQRMNASTTVFLGVSIGL